MSIPDFEVFAEAVATSTNTAPKPTPQLDQVTILGGGSEAKLLAALCLSEGASVTLFSAYGAELDELRSAGGITVRGDGPTGTYQIDQEGIPSIHTTAELDRAVASAEVIFLTGPVHKQRTYAMVLADHVRDGQVLVLTPGRTFGAAEAAWFLRIGGRKADITLVETQGLPFWYETTGSTLNLRSVSEVSAATLPAGRNHILQALQRYLPNILPNIKAATSTIHSGFTDGSGLVEVPALLLGGPAIGNGMPDLPVGGVPLEENKTFRSLIGSEQESVIASLATERRHIARSFGVRDLPTTAQWLDIHAGVHVSAMGGAGSRPVPTQETAAHMVRCATIGSLVPLVSAARIANRPAPVTEAMITLASSVLQADLASAGRKLETIGIAAENIDDARRILDDIARGAG